MKPEDITERQTFESAISAAVDRGEDEHQARKDLVTMIKLGKVAAYAVQSVLWVAPKEARNAANGDN